MSVIKAQYGTNNQAITLTLTAITNTSSQGSASVDNTTNLYLDALVQVTIKTAASSTSATGYLNVYAYASADGSTFTDKVTGTNASQTLTSPTNLKLIGVISAVANSTTYVGSPFSVAAGFNGTLPATWGIVVQNQTGATLDATIGTAVYQGILGQVV